MVDAITKLWTRSELDEKAVARGCRFNLEEAENFAKFCFKWLRLSKGEDAGKPLELLDWHWQELFGPMFGWMRADGTRRYRKAYAEVPKKNAKSTGGAMFGLYMLCADGESGAEVYSAATKRDQAAIVHQEAIHMVKASPELTRRLKINYTSKTITHEASSSKYAALAADGPGAEGLNIHALISDELHVWTNKKFRDSLYYGGIARRQPLFLTITTAGEDDKESIGWLEHERACLIRDGEIEDNDLLAYICAADPDDDMLLPATHKKANPAYNSIIKAEEIATEAKKCRTSTEITRFKRYRLNIWTGSSDAPIDTVQWDKCEDDYAEADLVGQRCHGGLDLASRRDITAWVLLFPPSDSCPDYRMLERLFVPGDTASAREKSDNIPYAKWAADGDIILTEGARCDYATIERQILEDGQNFDIVDIGADKWNLEYLRQRLPQVEMVEFGQSFASISSATVEFVEGLIPTEHIRHRKNAATWWMIRNFRTRMDGCGNIAPDKKGARDKIDCPVAIIMALGRAMVAEVEAEPYENEGVFMV